MHRVLLIVAMLASAALADGPGEGTRSTALVLPQRAFEATALGNYTNWGGDLFYGGNNVTGESAAIHLAYGAFENAQVGLTLALPIHPGMAFGSVVLDAAFAFGPTLALRADAGMEQIGVNGDNTGPNNHANRYLLGIGPYGRVAIAPALDLLWGRTSSLPMSRFVNVDAQNSMGFYHGANYASLIYANCIPAPSLGDMLVFSAGSNDTWSIIDVNIPFGLRLTPLPALSLTLQAGYSGFVAIPPSGTGDQGFGHHYLPVGLEVALSPVKSLEVGVNASLDGYLGASGAGAVRGDPGYFDMRSVLVWFRYRSDG